MTFIITGSELCPYCHIILYSFNNDDPLRKHRDYCDLWPKDEWIDPEDEDE